MMIKYKIFKGKDQLFYKYYDGHKISSIRLVDVQVAINEFLYSDFRIIINDGNLILKNDNTKIIIEDYQNIMDSPALFGLNKKLGIVSVPKEISINVNPSDFNDPQKRNAFLGNAQKLAISSVCAVLFVSALAGMNVIDYILKEEKNLNSLDSGIEETTKSDVCSSYNYEDNTVILSNILEKNIKELLQDAYRQKIVDFIVRENITVDQFDAYLTLLVDGNNPFSLGYKNEGQAFLGVSSKEELSIYEKFLMIMIKEGNTYEELDYMCAGCVGESTGDGECYTDAYAVASTLLNRTHSRSYYNKYGTRLYDQFMAPGQFEVELSGNYKKYLGRIDLPGYQAVVEAFYSKESMHNWIEFRARWVELTAPHDQFVQGGNKYWVRLNPEKYVEFEEEEMSREDVMKLVRSRGITF